MSGIEIAGLILGGLPLLITALEDYRRGSEPLKDWWRFQKVFKECYQNISIQKTFFEENLEQLLSPLVDDDDQLTRLLEEPGGDEWRDSKLEDALRSRLPRSYNHYLGIIQDINKIVEKLGNELGVTKVRLDVVLQKEAINNVSAQRIRAERIDQSLAPQIRTQMKWVYEFQRIKFSFWDRQERNVLIERFAQNNENLAKLLDSSDKSAASRKLRGSKKVITGEAFLSGIWSHANTLFSLITDSWRCNCQGLHQANLFLKHRTTPEIDFTVLLLFDKARVRPNPGSWTREIMKVKVIQIAGPELGDPVNLTGIAEQEEPTALIGGQGSTNL